MKIFYISILKINVIFFRYFQETVKGGFFIGKLLLKIRRINLKKKSEQMMETPKYADLIRTII